MRTVKVKVTPTYKNGNKAPYLIEEVQEDKKYGWVQEFKDAIKQAKERTRLSDFDSWEFKCSYV